MHVSRKRNNWLDRTGRFGRQGFIGLLLVLALLVGGFVFMHSSYFTVGRVDIKGNIHLQQDEIFQIADIDPQINIFKIDKQTVRKRLMQDLRIEDVTVERKFPTTIVLSIKERRTVAFVPTNYGFVQVDRQGYALAALRSIKSMGMPLLTGIKLINVKVGDRIEPVTHPVLEMLGELDEDALNTLSEINLTNPKAITGYTVNAIPVRFGEIQHPLEKAQLLSSVLKDIRQQKLSVEYIDIAYGTPVLKFRK